METANMRRQFVIAKQSKALPADKLDCTGAVGAAVGNQLNNDDGHNSGRRALLQ